VHILMTDILTCPRCGPRFGLILLADRISERRVVEGALGCANCREKYAIRQGIVEFPSAAEQHATLPPRGADADGADARAEASAMPPAGERQPDGAAQPERDDALRLAALLGVTAGPGYVLLAGGAATHAQSIADMVGDVEVVTAAWPVEAATLPVAPGANVSRLAVGAPLPLADARFAGVALAGAAADELLEEGARVLSPLGRLVVEPAPADAADRLAAVGFKVLVQEGRTLIAVNQHAGVGR
jgi:uncharacterized protein YbaR (Trm112 family)